jgi:hypothetical protein
MTDRIAQTVWSWLRDPGHGLSGLVAVADGKVVGLAHFRPMPSPLRRPLGERHTIAIHELLDPRLASLSLAAWGAGHGDEFLVRGNLGRARLRCTFDWSDLDD